MTVTSTELNERGHDIVGVEYDPVDNVCPFPVESRPVTGLFGPTWVRKWQTYRAVTNIVSDVVADADPDVVVADRRSIGPAVRGSDVPTVAVVQGLGLTRFDPPTLDLDKRPRFRSAPLSLKLQYPFVQSLHRQNEHGLHRASEVISVSEFIRKSLRHTFDCDSAVLRIPVRTDAFALNDHDPRCITGVNLRGPWKGPDVFLDIAAAMPDEEFLLVGPSPDEGTQRRAEQLDNVEYDSWVDDMSTVYERTKLLLVPSIYQEGSPRVIVEALCGGIPAVGSDRGGIPETIGTAGLTVSDVRDVDRWLERIDAVLENYDTYADAADAEAAKFDVDDRIDDFEALIDPLAGSP